MAPVLVVFGILGLTGAAFALLAYIAYRGSKPSDFFVDAVKEVYDLRLPETEINAFYDLKDRLFAKHCDANGGEPESEEGSLWLRRLAPEALNILKKSLITRLVRDIDRLDQVQRDKPGNWKLWRGKLITERYWNSLLDAERLVGEEIDTCVAEAEELEPGWREHVFPQAVQIWRHEKARAREEQAQKNVVVQAQKEKLAEERKKEQAVKQVEVDKLKKEKEAEKAMAKLIQEEEKESAKSKAKAGGVSKDRAAAPKSGSTKKKK